jgi:hypothetical protein
MKKIFNTQDSNSIIERIKKLSPETQPQWGKMNASQMLAHCNVAFIMAYENSIPKPNWLTRKLLTWFVKDSVVSEKPYKRNGQTAPAFVITTDKSFEEEQSKLIAYIQKTQALGAAYFEGRESHSFDKLTSTQWNNMFSKHLDHHLTQFGV